MTKTYKLIEGIIRKHVGKRVRSYPAAAVLAAGNYEMAIKALTDALVEQHERIVSQRWSALVAERNTELAAALVEVQRIKAMLADSETVHINIMRGAIALTKEQAVHIAGLPADIEAEVQRLQEQVRLLRRHSLMLRRPVRLILTFAIAYGHAKLLQPSRRRLPVSQNGMCSMTDFSVCKNCGRPIFYDWKGAHHIKPDHALPVAEFGQFDKRLDWSKPECDDPGEVPEQD